jgi:hypothetical protein
MERTLNVRKCSQCHQEGCNKAKSTCPVNAVRIGGPVVSVQSIVHEYLDGMNVIRLGPSPIRRVNRCGLCRREGCCRTNLLCPVKVEIERHKRLAFEMAPVRSFIVGTSPIDVKGDLYDHIPDPEKRQKQFDKLYRDILFMYEHERYQYIQRELTYSRSNIANPVAVVPKITVSVLNNYVKCEGDCGICYDSACNIMLNCKHQFCVDCIKGQFKIAKITKKFNCAFCRADIRSINGTDAEICNKLVQGN